MPTVSPPGSIDPTGAVDVSADLTTWFATVPANGDTIDLDPAATYRLDHTLLLDHLDGFVLNGNGALLFRDDGPLGTRSGPQLSVLQCDGWEIADLVIRGANLNAGVDGDYVQAKESHHCLWMSGCDSFIVHGCEFSQPFGDCSYFDAAKIGPAGLESSYLWCSQGIYELNKVHHSGRQLITLQGARDITIGGCDIWQARRSTFEMEGLAAAFNGVENITIQANRIGAGRFAVITNTGSAQADDVTFSDNLLARSLLIVGEDDFGGRRTGWSITNNRFITAGDDSPEVPVLATCAHHGSSSGCQIDLTRYDDLVITGNEANVDANRTPEMVFVQLTDCLNPTVSGNDVNSVVGGDGPAQCNVLGAGPELREIDAPVVPVGPWVPGSDWSYLIGAAMVSAALSCEVECDRHWVSDGGLVEQPPPGCPCQLVAVLSEGPNGLTPKAICGSGRSVAVRLVLDLCVELPGREEIPDPVAVSTRAQMNASIRWLMMQGLIFAASAGTITALDGPAIFGPTWAVTVDGWHPTRTTGGMGRWESTWTFADVG